VFDLRYHVASLTAVFVALVVGILVGVGLSGKGFVNDAERSNLNNQIADLRNERDSARASLDQATKGALALKDFSDSAYPAVVPGRLAGQKVAVLYAGPVDRGVSFAVEKAVRDAGGNVVRVRSLEVPIDVKAMEEALKRIPGQKRLLGTEHLDNLGNALAFEFAAGGKTPLWDALGKTMVQERDGSSTPTADALVVVRTAKPQQGPTRTFLTGLYDGLGRAGEPAVGTEVPGAAPSAFPIFVKSGLSTVDSIDTSTGRLGLVLLLQGAQPGSYGLGDLAKDGVLPPIPPVATQQ
jgi:hypothetical protein